MVVGVEYLGAVLVTVTRKEGEEAVVMEEEDMTTTMDATLAVRHTRHYSEVDFSQGS